MITLTHRQYREGIRKYILKRDPLCVICLKNGINSVTTEIDHIIPRSSGGAYFSPSNMQGLCKPCHEKKTASENSKRNKGRIPWNKEPNKVDDSGYANPEWLRWRERKLNEDRKIPKRI